MESHQVIEEALIAGIFAAKDREQMLVFIASMSEGLRPIAIKDGFTGERRKAISHAFAATLRGECPADLVGIMSWLESKPWTEILASIMGKTYKPDAETDGVSCLERIGGSLALINPASDNIVPPRSVHSILDHAVSLRNAAQQRTMMELMLKIHDALGKLAPNTSPAMYGNRAIDRITEILRGGSSQNVGDHMATMLANAATGIATQKATWGLSAMDALCPLRAGGLHILAAPPGCGKTSLALQAAAWSGADPSSGNVAICSMEMTGAELASIFVARAVQESATDVREGRLSSDKLLIAQELAEKWMADPAIYVDDSGACSIDSIGAWARQRQAAGNLRLLVIDYLQLMKGESRDTEYTTISKNTRALKMMAKDLNIPILCLSQLSRKGREDMRDRSTGAVKGQPEPRLSDLRGSGTIEQDADTVTFIHQPTEPDPRATVVPVRILVRKNRGGPEGSVDAFFYRKWQTFATEPPPPPGNRGERLRQAPDDNENHFGV